MIGRHFPGTAIRAAAVFCAVALGVFAAPAQAQQLRFEYPIICATERPVTWGANPSAGVRAGVGLRSPHNLQYTTVALCEANPNKQEGEADWGAIHWNQYGSSRTRDGVRYYNHRRGNTAYDAYSDIVGENTRENNVEMTVKTGVAIAATGLADMRSYWIDAALKVTAHGGSTLTIEKDATIAFNREPSYWPADADDRPSDGTQLYYSSVREAINSHSGVNMSGSGWAPITLTHNGVIDFNPRFGGSVSHWTGNGAGIWIHLTDYVPVAEGRKAFDITVSMGADSIVRNVAGSSGGNGMYIEQNVEDGDIRIDLAAGSLIDVSAEGGRGILAWLLPGGNFATDSAPDADGDKYLSGDIVVNAAGTIRAAVRGSPTLNPRQGSGINAHNDGLGSVRITSSGTIATVQGNAIGVRVNNAANERTDTAATTGEIEGHLIDVAGGLVETRGNTAISAWVRSANAAITVRVAEGAIVRAQALEPADYEAGAITQEQLGAAGNRYIYPAHAWGWRTVEKEETGGDGETTTVDRLEPLINAIVMRATRGLPAASGVADRAIVNGRVETIGGDARDAAILMQRGGAVTVGPAGVVKSGSGLAIAAGLWRPADAGEDYEAPETDLAVTVAGGGRVEGGIRVLDAGALTANIMPGGVVTGTIHNPQTPFTVADGVSIGGLRYAAAATVTVAGGGKLTGVGGTAIESAAGLLTVTVNDKGRVEGDILAGGMLTANIMPGGVVTGTMHNLRSPFTVADGVIIGRLRYAAAATVTVAGGGKLTGIGGTAIESAAGPLTVTVNDKGRVEGDILSGGALTADVKAGGVVTGTVRGGACGDGEKRLIVAGSVQRILCDYGGAVTVAGGGAVTGAGEEGAREAIRGDKGNLDVTVAGNGKVEGSIGHRDTGTLDVTVAGGGKVEGSIEDSGAGNLKAAVSGEVTGGIAERGAGNLDVTVSTALPGGIVGEGAGTHKVTVEAAGSVAGTVRLAANAETTVAGKVGRVLYGNGGTVTVNANGEIEGVAVEGAREAIRSDAGDLTVAVHGTVTGNIEDRGDGDLTVRVSESGTVAGEIFGRGGGVHTIEIAERARVLGTIHNPGDGTISGRIGRVLFDNGGKATVTATGSIAGIGGEAIRSAAGDLTVAVAGKATGRVESRGGALDATVTGTVEGDILGLGAGSHTVAVRGGGMVTGTVRLAASEVNVEHGAVARVLLDKGGEVKVGSRGRISGIEADGVRSAIRAEAGDLTVSVASGGAVAGRIEGLGAGDLTATVAGSVTGGIRGAGAGSHTVAVQEGGAVEGAVRLSSGAATVAGRVGRVLYDNGGSVSVAAAGNIAGVETADGGREAIRSAAGDLTVDVAAMGVVTGDIRGEGDGNLDVDVSGTVKGRIFGLGGGEHEVHVMSGGSVEGLIHLAASEVTIDGAARRVLFDRGGTVAVGSGGRLSGLGGNAVRSAAGDLTMTVSGNVMGSIVAGPGLMDRLTVLSGEVSGGRVEGVEFITVAAGGKLVGAEDERGRRAAIVVETGPLNLNADGRVEGDVDATDAGAASMVTIGEGGVVDGKIALAGAGSAVAVDGEAQSVDVPRGMVTVGENGRIVEPIVGAVALTVRAAPDESDEDAVQRVGGGRAGGAATVVLKREGRPDRLLSTAPDGAIRIGPSPRHRVYEALPSALLALNALPGFGGALASAGAGRASAAARYEPAADGEAAVARTAGVWRGAWARLHAGGGDRRPAASTAGGRHDIRRFAFEAGMEGASGDNALISISVHHVRGEADLEGTEGEGSGGGVEASGTGARLAGAWFPAGGFYVGGQAAATLYEADLTSADPQAARGALARDVSGRGYTIGAEAGRRFDLGRVALTPRARMSWSRIDMSPFTDAAGDRVSLDARSVKARAGVRVDTAVPVGGLFATADVERELSGAMRAIAADTVLETEPEATWLRLGLGGAHEWAGGRFLLRADANYAAARNGNRDFGGSASLTVRF